MRKPLGFLECKDFLLKYPENASSLNIIQKKKIMLRKRKDHKKTVNYWFDGLMSADMNLSGETIIIEIVRNEHSRIIAKMEGGEIVFVKEKLLKQKWKEER